MKHLAKLIQPSKRESVDWGELRTLQPLCRKFGLDRGTPIRRYYIERFLASNKGCISGRVLEVGDDTYSKRFGTEPLRVDVLTPSPAPGATVIGDLVTGAGVPKGVYNAVVLTQVLHVLADMHAAIKVTRDALKPGGVVLATIPCISQVSAYDMERWGDYWRATDRGARAAFESVFDPESITLFTYGNVLTAVGSLLGLAAEELTKHELDFVDQQYQVLIGVRARCQ